MLAINSCSNLLVLGLQQDPESGQQRCHLLPLQGQTVLKNMELLIQNTLQPVESSHLSGGVADAGWKVHRDLEADRREQAPA